MAAQIAVAGMDPLGFLECEDPVVGMTTIAIMRRYFSIRQELDRNLAHEIVNTLAKSMKSQSRGPSGAY